MSEGVFTMPLVSAGVAPFPSKVDNFQRASSGTAAGTLGLSISAKPGRCYRAYAANTAATAYFLQIFDKATAPVNGDVPIEEKRLPASTECEIDMTNVNGVVCALGIGLAISSTAGTLTLAVAADLGFRRVIFTASQ
jgi:hypothetical protein